jgi:hypothetical protein
MLNPRGNKTKTEYANKAGKTKDQLMNVSRRVFQGTNTRREMNWAAELVVATTRFFIEGFIEVGIVSRPLSLLA